MIALCVMYLPNAFIFYFNITWFYRYLEQGRGLQGWTLAFFAGLPLLLSVIADVAGGTMTDWAVRRSVPTGAVRAWASAPTWPRESSF